MASDPEIIEALTLRKEWLLAQADATNKLLELLNGHPAANGNTTKPNTTARQRKARSLNGAYMAAMRHLAPTARGQVRAVRQRDGIEAAIRFAKSLAG